MQLPVILQSGGTSSPFFGDLAQSRCLFFCFLSGKTSVFAGFVLGCLVLGWGGQGQFTKVMRMSDWQDAKVFLFFHRFHRRSKHGNFPDCG
jgi:hypothetical protein